MLENQKTVKCVQKGTMTYKQFKEMEEIQSHVFCRNYKGETVILANVTKILNTIKMKEYYVEVRHFKEKETSSYKGVRREISRVENDKLEILDGYEAVAPSQQYKVLLGVTLDIKRQEDAFEAIGRG